MFRFLISSGIGLALASAPAVAAVQPRPAAPAIASEIQPAAEQAEGSELRRGFILPLVGVVALLVIVFLLTRDEGTEAVPLSP